MKKRIEFLNGASALAVSHEARDPQVFEAILGEMPESKVTVELTRRFIKPKVRAHAWEPGPRCGTRWQFAPGDQRLRHWRLRRYGGEN